MIEYHTPCFSGSPSDLGSLPEIELTNFAVMRNSEQRVVGVAFSADEIQCPVVGIRTDDQNLKVWIEVEGAAAVWFIPSDHVPLDALVLLKESEIKGMPVAVYNLPVVDEIADLESVV